MKKRQFKIANLIKIMVKPKGLFEEFLKTQLQGLTSNIGVAGYPFNIVECGSYGACKLSQTVFPIIKED